ncbi:unnamed protein product, partial [marine sediment metagenome]
FEKSRKAELLVSLKLTNAGKSPASIKELELTIRDVSGEKPKYSFNLLHNVRDEEGNEAGEYVVFPNEVLDKSFWLLVTPETINYESSTPQSAKDRVRVFNELYGPMQEFIGTEEFVCEVYAEYSIFGGASKEEIYRSHKVWVVQPKGETASPYYYDID